MTRRPPLIFALAILAVATAVFAADSPAPAPSDSNSQFEAKKSILELYRAGGFFMIPLTACSVLAVAIIIERFAALRRSAVIPSGFLAGLRRVAKDLREDRE